MQRSARVRSAISNCEFCEQARLPDRIHFLSGGVRAGTHHECWQNDAHEQYIWPLWRHGAPNQSSNMMQYKIIAHSLYDSTSPPACIPHEDGNHPKVQSIVKRSSKHFPDFHGRGYTWVQSTLTNVLNNVQQNSDQSSFEINKPHAHWLLSICLRERKVPKLKHAFLTWIEWAIIWGVCITSWPNQCCVLRTLSTMILWESQHALINY